MRFWVLLAIRAVRPASGNRFGGPLMQTFQTFRFKTRIQRLNSMEASSRAKINFLEALYRFHKQRGRTQIAVPTINHQPIDLWSFRNEVRKLGGFETVSGNDSPKLVGIWNMSFISGKSN